MDECTLSSNDLQVTLDPTDGSLTIQLGPSILRGHCQAEVDSTSRHVTRITGHRVKSVTQQPTTDQHGEGKQVAIQYTPDAHALSLTLEASLYKMHPFIAMRVGLTNHGTLPQSIATLTPLTTTTLDLGTGPLDAWVNGFHSWSFTGFVPYNRLQPRTTLGQLTWPYAHNPTTPLPRQAGRYIAEEVGALIERDQQALVVGFIGLAEQFGQVYLDGRPGHKTLTLQTTADGYPLDPGETLWGEWAILYRLNLPHSDPLGIYANTAAHLTPGRVPNVPPQPGWSSWYQFFANVSADDMARNQHSLRERHPRLPIERIQLDDGYQPAWGDWLDHNDKFPDGIPAWATSVCSDGFEPGLWLSPFTVDRWARIFNKSPDAVLRDSRNRPVRGGIRVDRALHWLYGLDPTHPATQDHVRRVVETIVHEWGIPYLKLDFLYCAALPGKRYNPKRTRAQALRDGLKLIREVAGEGMSLVGCGCPLGPAIGLVDIMRVSPDVAPDWHPKLFGLTWPFRRDPSLPAARNAIHNSIHRQWTHRHWWWLDADNLLVREQQNLTEAEIQTLVTVLGLVGSHLILSDDVSELSKERSHWAEILLPIIQQGEVNMSHLFTSERPDTLVRRFNSPAGKHTVVAAINWEETPTARSLQLATLGLPNNLPILVCDFWQQRVSLHEGDIMHIDHIQPHGVALFSLRPAKPGPQLAGSDLHISMGTEITTWEAKPDKLHFTINLGREAEGQLWFKLPTPPNRATGNGQPVAIKSAGGHDLYILQAAMKNIAEFTIWLS